MSNYRMNLQSNVGCKSHEEPIVHIYFWVQSQASDVLTLLKPEILAFKLQQQKFCFYSAFLISCLRQRENSSF